MGRRKTRQAFDESVVGAHKLDRVRSSLLLQRQAEINRTANVTANTAVSGGDMTKAQYDPDNDGKVESAKVADTLATVRYTTATLPAPSATYLGKFVRVKNAGEAEMLLIGLENSGGTYSWAIIAMAGS